MTIESNLVLYDMEKVNLIEKMLEIVQSSEMPYSDFRNRDLEFHSRGLNLFEGSSMKGVMQFL